MAAIHVSGRGGGSLSPTNDSRKDIDIAIRKIHNEVYHKAVGHSGVVSPGSSRCRAYSLAFYTLTRYPEGGVG